jgi:hypothetical protein
MIFSREGSVLLFIIVAAAAVVVVVVHSEVCGGKRGNQSRVGLRVYLFLAPHVVFIVFLLSITFHFSLVVASTTATSFTAATTFTTSWVFNTSTQGSGKKGSRHQLLNTATLLQLVICCFTKLRFLHRMTFVFQTPFLILAKSPDRGYS